MADDAFEDLSGYGYVYYPTAHKKDEELEFGSSQGIPAPIDFVVLRRIHFFLNDGRIQFPKAGQSIYRFNGRLSSGPDYQVNIPSVR